MAFVHEPLPRFVDVHLLPPLVVLMVLSLGHFIELNPKHKNTKGWNQNMIKKLGFLFFIGGRKFYKSSFKI